MTHIRGSTAEPSSPIERGTDSTETTTPGIAPAPSNSDAVPDNTLPIPAPSGDPPPVTPLPAGDPVAPPVAFDPRFLAVLAYDVITVGDEPRLVVSVRESRDAHAMAARLNQMRDAGLLISLARYTVALPREITRDVPSDPSAPVITDGYTLAPSAFAVKEVGPGDPKE